MDFSTKFFKIKLNEHSFQSFHDSKILFLDYKNIITKKVDMELFGIILGKSSFGNFVNMVSEIHINHERKK